MLNYQWTKWCAAALVVCAANFEVASCALGQDKQSVEIGQYLASGKLADAQATLSKRLIKAPKDDQLRTGLGIVQFTRAVEHLAQSLYRYGSSNQTGVISELPFLRLPVPKNEHPDRVRYADVRQMLQGFIDDVAVAEKTLSAVEDRSIKLSVPLARIRLDVNANGIAENDELLLKMVAAVAMRGNAAGVFQEIDLTVGFDYADVLWLRGYCHLLSAMANALLMYDEHAVFDLIAVHLFAKPDLPVTEFPLRNGFANAGVDPWVDLIAAVHKAVFPVLEPERGPRVLAHLQQVVELSRLTWKEILSETDNDREWIPNPKQKSVLPNVIVTETMVNTWHDFLEEADGLLSGELLVPHWRFPVEAGVNLKRFFTEPRELDVVMLVHGSAALPYAQRGRCSKSETWDQFQRVFGGRFIGFAVWFN